MKRLLTLVIVLSLLLCCGMNALAIDAAGETSYTDVAEDAWYYGDVYAAQALGLMEGVGEGRFSPDSSLTLAEAVTLAARARSLYLKDEEAFVRHDEWYRVYGDYALANSILKEEPTDWTIPATRTVCAALFAAAMPDDGLKSINTISDGAIPDVPSDAAVYTLYRAGVMVGDDAHRFHPNDPIRRCEIAAVVNRLLQPESRLSVTLTEPDESHGSSPSGGHHEWEPVTEPVVDPTTEPSDDTTNSDGEVTVPYDLSHPEEFASGDVLYEDGSMLVKFKTPFAGTVSGPLKDAGVAKLDKLMDLEGAVWYTAYLSAGTDVHEAVDAVRAMDNVILAEYNFVYTAEAVVADDGPISEAVLDNAQINDQWYINSVGIQSAWQFQRGSLSENFKPHMQNENPPEEGQPEEPEQPGDTETLSGGSSDVVVAVIDTGVDYTHEDLRTNMWHNPGEIADNGIDDDGNGYVDDYFGIDIVAGHGSGNDDHGHGTHVAGIIAAVNNDRGVVGVAYNTRIMSVKAGQSSGFFTQSAIAAAVIYAANNGADVINMSFGGPSITMAVQDALAYAYTRCVLVAAAGNDGVGNNVPACHPGDQPTYPAALPYVLGVMSVDRYGNLSRFSNFDCIPFDNYEYEVYAPGEAMLSTIPGDRYASWNGTSMAAPMVSGVAALLRSEFTDRNTYPTKFIYGQLSGTGPLGPDGYHRIVNAYDALTILPQPDVETTEYRLFDTPGFDLDTAGKNTGDGVIDAGETVAIGFFLRNHWGMAKNVTVSVDALSPAGLPCPYLEILTESADYGTVGTYSTKDAGQIMTDSVFTGWENPIYLHITDNCPNDYIIALNVHVTAENALDPDDDTIYQSDKVYYLEVRRGTVLPQIINSDMTLTKENLYIIPNATTIESGVTVTVEPGTRIQFWTDDPHDAYADQYMAGLIVKGTLLVNGTAEEPVEMFPSDLMSDYCVQIDTRDRTELRYAKITNPLFAKLAGNSVSNSSVTYAEGCEFTTNYADGSYIYRSLYNGQVATFSASEGGGRINIINAKDCVFYKLNFISGSQNNINIGKAIGCAFIDSCFNLQGITYAEDCLFYGNDLGTNRWGTNLVSFYSLDASNVGFSSLKLSQQIRDPETGKSYLVVINDGYDYRTSYGSASADVVERLAEFLGGTLACPETQHERDFLRSNGISGIIGLHKDSVTGTITWENGHAFDEEDWTIISSSMIGIEEYSDVLKDNHYVFKDDKLSGSLRIDNKSYSSFIIELPSDPLIENIMLQETQISLDTEDSYTLIPIINPVITNQTLRFFSGCEEIATVSDDGVITPVELGSTRIYIYSEDMCVGTSLIVTVESPVEADTISFPEDELLIAKNEELDLEAVITPFNSTKRPIYSSDNPGIVSVNEDGHLIAVETGNCTVTASIPGTELSATLEVTVVPRAISLTAQEATICLRPEDGLDAAEALGISLEQDGAGELPLKWSSSNPEVLDVNEDGQLVFFAGLAEDEEPTNSWATLRAEAVGSKLFVEVTICVSENTNGTPVLDMGRCGDYYYYALLADGSVWYWGSNVTLPRMLPFPEAARSPGATMFTIFWTLAGHFMPINPISTTILLRSRITTVHIWVRLTMLLFMV